MAENAQPKYADLLGQTKDEKEASDRVQQVKRAKISLETTILNTESQVENANANITRALREYPVNWATVVEAQREAEIAQDNMDRLKNMSKTLF